MALSIYLTFFNFQNIYLTGESFNYKLCANISDEKEKKYAKSLYERCKRDVNSIKKCACCFSFWLTDSTDFFTQVCDKPHLLLWVKYDDYPYWPAKLMSVDGTKVNVEFFDESHSQADIDVEYCLLYSKKSPGRNSTALGMKEALKVIVVITDI